MEFGESMRGVGCRGDTGEVNQLVGLVCAKARIWDEMRQARIRQLSLKQAARA